ncbi:hypothetical protein [Bacillus cereus group sp. TH152-1LC]|uniref:hypothetical protein n=1 Tax=Bacillus cereus group sp. TH152-1LC TaxID=3018060 RepID=UPI0022E474F8|nr:hypothetical protein [Bacillus cereus group sp. TH152-1LC]MDA1674580.1 hypothetical protein [Bacillus cereus group sp. TH152-1LC]
MQRLMLKVPDGIVKGFDDKDDLQGYLIDEKLEESGYDIYEVKQVLQEIENSELDEEDKKVLLKKLQKDEFEFEINDCLCDVLDNCDSMYDLF